MRTALAATILLAPLSACIPDGEPRGLWRGGLPDMPFTSTLVSGVSDSAGGIWVAGGGYATTQSMNLARFDLATLEWETRTALTTTTGSPLLSGSVTYVDSTLYACAYLASHDPSGYCVRYDEPADAWISIPPPPMPLSINLRIAELVGRLALFDGSTQLALYDPVSQQWSQAPPIDVNVFVKSLGTYDGKLWAFSLNASPLFRTVQMYDPATNSWSTAASNPEDFDIDFGVATIGDRMWLVRKGPFVDFQNNVREPSALLTFDPATGTFDQKDELDEQVRDATVFGVGSTVFIAGGVEPDTIFETPLSTFQGFVP